MSGYATGLLALDRSPVPDAMLLLDPRRLCNKCGMDVKRKGCKTYCATCFLTRYRSPAFVPCKCGATVFRRQARNLRQLLCGSCRKEAKRRNSRVYNHRQSERRRATIQTARAARVGLTVSDVLALEEQQGNACAICKREVKLQLDHCHTTGQVRGLLCGECNRGLGLFKDDPKRLAEAVAYLAAQEMP